jgi:hypothetical protein
VVFVLSEVNTLQQFVRVVDLLLLCKKICPTTQRNITEDVGSAAPLLTFVHYICRTGTPVRPLVTMMMNR